MKARGFALLAVLWVLAALTALAGVAMAVARTGADATRNRLLLARAGWAREACAEILLARYAEDSSVRRLDTVDLGRGTWCAAALVDAGARLNVNRADPPVLHALLRLLVDDTLAADSLTQAILARRRVGPIVDLAQLASLAGCGSALVARLEAALTVRGLGPVDVNTAPPDVLAALPGLTPEAIAILIERRTTGHLVTDADALETLVSEHARSVLLAAYPEFVRATTFRPVEFVGRVEGGIRGSPLRARVTLSLVPAPGRLAVIRRETE